MSLAACATQGDANLGSGLYDPLERVNRATFEFNIKFDEAIAAPVAKAYREALPAPVRAGIRNFTDNLNSPITFINDLLQGEFTRAQITLARFLINTTAGFAGINDAAKDAGLPGHKEDFGQTLGYWGGEPSPYLVLPFLGPSTLRDTIGLGGDIVTDPLFSLEPHTPFSRS